MLSSNKLLCTIALLLGSAAPAFACGPDFAHLLLVDRRDTLLGLPEGKFNFEVTHLLPAPNDPFKASEAGPWEEPAALREKVDHDTLQPGELTLVAQARSQPDADQAYAAGKGLPEELRQYTAGGVAFAAGQYAVATERFKAVLALPVAQRLRRGAWAAYMLGRSAARLKQVDVATAAFVQTRELVQQGAQDPLGLAVASFGEQARLQLERGDMAAAINLYATQAAHDSTSGRDSLLQLARQIIAQPQQIEKQIADPLTQRLLVAYAYARSNEFDPSASDAGAGDTPQATSNLPKKPPAKLQRLLQAIEARGLDHVAGADRLAAVAYSSAQFDLAGKLASHDDSPMSWWVRAKLALRNNDASAAAQAYARAAAGFPASEDWGGGGGYAYADGGFEELRPSCRVNGEAATLALSRRDYREAIELLYRAGAIYWSDTAYIAERVLSVEELKAFVDAKVPAAAAKPATPSDGEPPPPDPATQLRDLLARRLLRSAHYDDAPGYFANPELAAKAGELVAARHASASGSQVARAQAYFAAARLERWKGLELIGYEGDPDFAQYEAEFDLNSPVTYDPQYNAVEHPRSDLKIVGDYTSDDERSRVAASKAEPLVRFHYRLNAVADAGKSADLLPPRSQAFAAVLCQSTSWVIDRQPALAQSVYARYLKQGPLVPWGATFGRTCPEPDFPAAERRLWNQKVAFYKHQVRHWGPWLAGVLIVLAGLIVWSRRRRKQV